MNIFELYDQIEAVYTEKQNKLAMLQKKIVELSEKKEQAYKAIKENEEILRHTDHESQNIISLRNNVREQLEKAEKSLKRLDIWNIIQELSNKNFSKEQAKAHWESVVNGTLPFEDPTITSSF